MTVDTSTWDKSLVEMHKDFVANIHKMSVEWLQHRIMTAEVDAADPILRGEAECCAATIEAAQAELAKRQ